MLSYTFDHNILTLTVSGTPTAEDRTRVFGAIEADDRVPEHAPLLIDVRQLLGGAVDSSVTERLERLVALLGVKLGFVCAILVANKLTLQARLFKKHATAEGALRVEVFTDEHLARQWLTDLP
jgi:hypothetical protein